MEKQTPEESIVVALLFSSHERRRRVVASWLSRNPSSMLSSLDIYNEIFQTLLFGTLHVKISPWGIFFFPQMDGLSLQERDLETKEERYLFQAAMGKLVKKFTTCTYLRCELVRDVCMLLWNSCAPKHRPLVRDLSIVVQKCLLKLGKRDKVKFLFLDHLLKVFSRELSFGNVDILSDIFVLHS